ncbi:unnamed protein product [Paramecium octaurelia]|uniref:Uncharacterized protein n=1 Tax=Paramecium octaurelia TaxID=43137 RepID=A0A8S1TZE7_PAROT|nr:unnamed protein product [Paramecium octaurelia]
MEGHLNIFHIKIIQIYLIAIFQPLQQSFQLKLLDFLYLQQQSDSERLVIGYDEEQIK